MYIAIQTNIFRILVPIFFLAILFYLLVTEKNYFLNFVFLHLFFLAILKKNNKTFFKFSFTLKK